MKNLILVLVSFLTLTFANAQNGNGGQHFQNNSVTLQLVGYSLTGKAIVKVENRQNCQANIRLSFGSNDTRLVSVNANAWSDTLHLTVPSSRKIQAKTETNCGSADFGQVELEVAGSLPISSVSISATRVNASTFKLNLALGQVDGTNNIVIVKIRPNVTTVAQSIVVPIPDGLSNTTYVVTLTYANKSWKVLKATK